MRKSTAVLLALFCLNAGIVMGFLFAPIKKGVYMKMGNNCGNNSGNKEPEKDVE